MKYDLTSAFKQIDALVSLDTSPENPTIGAIEYVQDIFTEHDIDYVTKPIGNDGKHAVILGRLGPDVPGGVLFSGHLDVVNIKDQVWSHKPFAATLDGEKLYGRGTCDMKGFIGSILSLIPLWKRGGLSYPIYFGFTCDEETKVKSINDLVSLIDPKKRPDIAILGEPTSMDVINGHKGVFDLSVELIGKGGHSSRPDLGLDAIRLAHEVSAFIYERSGLLKDECYDASYMPPYPTLDIVKMLGGSGINKIPEIAQLYFHMRQTDQRQPQIERKKLENYLASLMTRVSGADFRVEEKLLMPALERRNGTVAQAFMKALNFDTSDRTVPFCTEAGYLQAIGMETIVCGPGNIAQAHTADEYVEVEQIEKCLKAFSILPRKMPN